MRIFKTFSASLTVIFLLSGFMMSNAQTPAKTKEIKIHKVTFDCGKGKAKIEQGLKQTDGVQTVVADIPTQTVTITYDPAKTDKDHLVKRIEQLGFYTEYTPKNAKIVHDCEGVIPADTTKCKHTK
jgi:copper chaperone CopZ